MAYPYTLTPVARGVQLRLPHVTLAGGPECREAGSYNARPLRMRARICNEADTLHETTRSANDRLRRSQRGDARF